MERTLKERQMETVTWLLVDYIDLDGWKYEDAERQNDEGWTVDVSNGRNDGSWLRCEGVQFSAAELSRAWSNANDFRVAMA